MTFTQYITGSSSNAIKWSYFVLLLMLTAVALYFIRSAVKKIYEITNPKTNHSYCKISVTIVKLVIFNLVVMIFGLVW